MSIYLDHAASTPLDPRVLKVMRTFESRTFANPSSFHTPGLRAKEAVMASRRSIAARLNCREDEVIFTSGGTESDNLAVVGIPRAHKAHGRHAPHQFYDQTLISSDRNKPEPGRFVPPLLGGTGAGHVITSAIEHPAALEPLKYLQRTGEIELTVLPVDRDGLISITDMEKALRPDTVLVSIMYANNEIGTIEPIADIGRAILRWRKDKATPYPYFHTDACQAAGALDLDVEKLHADLLTLNGSKIYGPKGIGVLYVRRGLKLEPLIRGGGQEKNLRSGTENVPGIVGLAQALEIAQAEKDEESARLIRLRDRLIEGLLAIPKSRLNGHPSKRLPNNVNVSFLDIEGEAAVLYLDAEGIYCSTGSACASASLDPSHVILATGLSYEAAHGSLRFTLGRSTTAKDVERVIAVMPAIVEKLRHMSPVNLDMKYFS